MATDWMGISRDDAMECMAVIQMSKEEFSNTLQRCAAKARAVRWDGAYAERYKDDIEAELGSIVTHALNRLELKRMEIQNHLDRQEQLSTYGR